MTEEKSPIKIKKIGHVVLTVSDIERSSKFWTDIMGFKFSDKNETGMAFFRNATDHHTVALVQATEKSELPDLGGSHAPGLGEFLRSKGVTIFYEGRRGPGGNPGLEFYDPDGYKIEIYAAMDQIGTDGHSRPANEWKRATTLEQAVENPLPGAEYH